MMRHVLALLVLLALQFVPGVGVGDAQAGCSGNQCDSIEEAYAYGMQLAQNENPCTGSVYGPPKTYNQYRGDPRNWEIVTQIRCVRISDGTVSSRKSIVIQFPLANGGCPAGTAWDEPSKTCYSADRCLAKPPLGATKVEGLTSFDFKVCVQGCSYEPPEAVALAFVDDDGTQRAYVNGYKPSGAACAAGDPVGEALPPLEADCAPLDHGQTACQKPNGLICYKTTRTGRQICWRPGETGEKVDGDILQRRVAGVVVGSPSTIPPYGAMYEPAAAGVEIMAKYGYFRKEGGGTKVLDSTSTQTTTTQNFQTTGGVNAGGSAPDQGENTDGSAGSSPGNQGPGGSGSGSGDGDGGAGEAGEGIAQGDLYEKSGDTIGSVFADFKTEAEGTALVGAAAGFFGGCDSLAGTCPTASWEAEAFGISLSLAELCGGLLLDLLAMAGWVMLAGISFYSFKVAFL